MNMHRNHRGERGAVAIIVALSVLVIMASAALGFDIAKQVYEKQQLQNSLDAAAAAGAAQLPDYPAQAKLDAAAVAAQNMVGANLGSITPQIALRCVVGYNSTTKSPDWATVVAICGITSKAWTALDCNEQICSLECTDAYRCNTIVVKYNKTVEYSFGPAIGIPTGQTGSVVAAACRGFCGTVSPNPMDVVVMADRTPSMKDNWDSGEGYKTPAGSFQNMKDGIEDMLGAMNQQQQYVAFGTIAISVPKTGDLSAQPSGGEAFTDATYRNCDKYGKNCWTVGGKKWHFKGKWVPVGFTNKYTTYDASGLPTMDKTSDLYKAVHNLKLSEDKVDYPQAADGNKTSSNEGTHLASALKGAARYLLNTDPVKDAGLPLRPEEFGIPKKVIIFETDGSPSEIFNSDDSAVTLKGNDLDIGVNGNGQKKSCENFAEIAKQAKAEGILLITIGVGAVNKADCGTSGGKTIYVRDVLASAASPKKSGAASDAYDCTQSGKTALENADGDYYFCAATSADLKSVFLAAMGSLNAKSKLMQLPNMYQ